jgi:hypothetical protein
VSDPTAEAHEPVSHKPANEAELKTTELLKKNPGRRNSLKREILLLLCRHYARTRLGLTRKEIATLLSTPTRKLSRDDTHPRVRELERGEWVTRPPDLINTSFGFIPTEKALMWAEYQQD